MAYADDDERSRETLRGIKEMSVFVKLTEIGKELELTEEQLQTDVELKLRLADINISSKPPLSPYVFSATTGFFKVILGTYVFVIQLSFSQPVYLARNSKEAFAITWTITGHGWTKTNQYFRESFNGHIDMFINAYLSVNPK